MKRARILGIPFNNLTADEILSKVEHFVRDSKSHIIVFLSLPFLVVARRNKMLRIFLEEADIIIPSGKYIQWAARLLKHPLKELIDPSLFVKQLMQQSVVLGKNVYLFGGKGNTIEKAFANLKKEIPKLFVIGKHRGVYKKSEHENIVMAIGKASPDYFFIGLGSPQEEVWVNRNKRHINARLIILIEGLFGLYAGNIKKISYRKNWNFENAPKREILSTHGFKRVVRIPLFVILVLIQRAFWKN
jgi:N-acetylglucosaminyldiphosphoundecaprenol N-acetyl-beta-D-mannosaminyltransferase